MYSLAGVDAFLPRFALAPDAAPAGTRMEPRLGSVGCWKRDSVMDGEGDNRGGVMVPSRDRLAGYSGATTGGVASRRMTGASSDSVMVVKSICACETARGAGSTLLRPGVNIFGRDEDDHAR